MVIKPETAAEDSTWRADSEAHIKRVVQDNILAHQRLLDTSIPTLIEIAAALSQAIQAGKKILLFGNGGSAADAQHVAAEMMNSFLPDRAPWPVIALTTDTSILTAVSNDMGFDQVFARQVEALAMPGDVIVGISASGRSRNVLLGLEAGRRMGAVRVGFTGQDPGAMREVVELCFCAPALSTPRIQELHLAAWHVICDLIERRLYGTANPKG